MATMGNYCKAYYLRKLRAFAGWNEKKENARKESEGNGEGNSGSRTLGDDSIVYVQENYFVTDDIFKDENIIFDEVTPQWIEFCTSTLGFQVPDYAKDEEELETIGAETPFVSE